jgi:uncharacterized integral membrane protein
VRKLISWLTTVPAAAVVIVFCAINRDSVTIDLWPFPYLSTQPLWLVVLGAVFLGFVWGALVAWGGGRTAARRARAEAAELKARLTAARPR